MSKRQKTYYDFIVKYRKKHGFSPTYAEIGAAFGVSDGAAHAMVKRLEKMGYLKTSRFPRMLEVLK